MFYCPNCRKEYEIQSTNTITTNSGRVAYKANCPRCGQDMAEFIEEKEKHSEGNAETTVVGASEQVENVDQGNGGDDSLQENDFN